MDNNADKKPHKKVVLIIILTLLIDIFASAGIIVFIVPGFVRNILFVFLTILLFIIGIKLLSIKRNAYIIYIIFLLLLILGKSLYSLFQFTPSLGNNANVSSYETGIFEKSYSYEDILGYDYDELYETKDVIFLFSFDDDMVKSREYLNVNNRYYSMGGRNLKIDFSTEYDSDSTIISDILMYKQRKGVFPYVDNTVWGVVDSGIRIDSINDYTIDRRISFKLQSGKAYELWIIDDFDDVKTSDDIHIKYVR